MSHPVIALSVSLVVTGHAVAAGIPGQGTWETTLLPRDLTGDGQPDAFYDTALNVTWLREANVGGRYTWDAAIRRAENLTTGGYTDWRLPKVRDTGTPGCTYSANWTDCGYNVQTADSSGVYSELAHLCHVSLGNLSQYDTTGRMRPEYGLTNTGAFSGLQSWDYWSGTELATDLAQSWYFSTVDGAQLVTDKSAQMYLLILRDGDVAPVPESGTLALSLAGLAWLAVQARRRRQGATALHCASARSTSSNFAARPVTS